ncbi:MAG TPA: penicillin acylase family protein [Acidimicrobiia bacterium]|nr:penicillin acylase family protein [Acidimicrobiia bacterium]
MNPARALLRLLGRRLPVTSGALDVEGLIGPVTIHRDRFGVPHVEATTPDDAWFGLGFCQGQDRAFQIETRIRVVRGTLAALVGRDALAVDELSRRVGFARYGEAVLAGMRRHHRSGYEAFAAGVRAGIDRGRGGRVHEFTLLRTRPTPFSAADAVGFLAVQAFALASNWDTELARLRMLALDGPEAVAALHPPYAADLPVSDRPGEAAGRVVDALAGDLARARELFTPGGGSNNWALAGRKTRTGRPLLANDPHLAPVLPAHWYLAHLSTPDWSVTGASLPAVPTFGAGHNQHAAWGVTAGLIDNTDLFMEEVGPDNASVRRGDEFVPCDVRREVIEVRGSDPVTIDVLETDRGPVVGPAFEGAFGALSMSATWLQPDDIGATIDLCRVRSFADLREVYGSWTSVPLNVAFADESDTVGWQLIGSAPVRGRGGGTIPLDASDPETRWKDEPVRFEELPHAVDPPSGFVATANNLPSADGPYLGSDFLDGYRAQRIAESLAERDDWDVATTLRLQLDQQSIPWREMREIVLDALEESSGPAVALLRDWDGVVGPDSPAATIFEVMVAEMCRRVAEAKAPKSSALALGDGFTPLVPFNGLLVRRVSHLVSLLHEQPGGWFDSGWGGFIRDSLGSAIETLIERLGPDPGDWAWGMARPLRLKHPLGIRKPLGKIYDLGPFPHGGDANTVNPAPVDPRDPLRNPDFAIASLRMVVDIGAWENSRFSLPGGQSGNPFSRHYADQLPLWRRGDGVTIAQERSEVTRVARSTLELAPTGERTEGAPDA